MREWCSCGAAIRARRSDVLTWRKTHQCPDKPAPEGDMHVGAGAHVEHAGARGYDGETPIVTARIGFTPNAAT